MNTHVLAAAALCGASTTYRCACGERITVTRRQDGARRALALAWRLHRARATVGAARIACMPTPALVHRGKVLSFTRVESGRL